MHFLIIGNSAAGNGALEAIRRCDRQSSVTIVSDEDYPLYSRCLLSYFLAESIDEAGLLFKPPDFHRNMDAKVILGKRVVSIDAVNRRALCSDGTRLNYDRLLIATGSSPKVPKNIPKDVDGVFVLRSVADAVAIKNKIRPAGNAVVLGGGLVGLKAAFALNKRGMQVAVVIRSSHVLSQMIDFNAGQIVMERLRENGIEVFTGADVIEVETKNGRLSAVRIEGETTIDDNIQPCDMLIAAKGVEPNTGLISESSVKRNWGITTDARMRTSVENIYAAGDVAETFDIATERNSVNALWTCAVQQGKIAGFNMAGREREYDGSLGMNSINFPGVDLISFGLVRPREDAGCEILLDRRPRQGIYKKLVLKNNRIKGLILVNGIDNAGVLLSLLGRKVDVADFKGELLSDAFNYAKVIGGRGRTELQRYWNAAHPVENS